MQQKKRKGGSPHPETCANIDSCGSANNSSPSEMKKAATAGYRVPPVPLYLIPVAIKREIQRTGEAIEGVCVKRSAHHMYAITVRTCEEAGHA